MRRGSSTSRMTRRYCECDSFFCAANAVVLGNTLISGMFSMSCSIKLAEIHAMYLHPNKAIALIQPLMGHRPDLFTKLYRYKSWSCHWDDVDTVHAGAQRAMHRCIEEVHPHNNDHDLFCPKEYLFHELSCFAFFSSCRTIASGCWRQKAHWRQGECVPTPILLHQTTTSILC